MNKKEKRPSKKNSMKENKKFPYKANRTKTTPLTRKEINNS